MIRIGDYPRVTTTSAVGFVQPVPPACPHCGRCPTCGHDARPAFTFKPAKKPRKRKGK